MFNYASLKTGFVMILVTLKLEGRQAVLAPQLKPLKS